MSLKKIITIASTALLGACALPESERYNTFADKVIEMVEANNSHGEKSKEFKEAYLDLVKYDYDNIPEIDLFKSPHADIRKAFEKHGYFYINYSHSITLGRIKEKREDTAKYHNTMYPLRIVTFNTLARSSTISEDVISYWRENTCYMNLDSVERHFSNLKEEAEAGDFYAKKAMEEIVKSRLSSVDFYISSLKHHELAHKFTDDEYEAYKNQYLHSPRFFMLRILRGLSHEDHEHGAAARKLYLEINP